MENQSTNAAVVETPNMNREAAAANEAAAQAALQAREQAEKAIATFSGLDKYAKIYLVALATVAVSILIFDMLSFEVQTKGAVSETMAIDQREWEKSLNGNTYSGFAANFWGKAALLAALSGISLFVWARVTRQTAGWIPLVTIGCGAACILAMLLLAATGTPGSGAFALLPRYLEPDVDLTLLGYWLPLLAAAAAAGAAVKRLTAPVA